MVCGIFFVIIFYFFAYTIGDEKEHYFSYFPTDIPHYHIRRDTFTSEDVSHGRLEMIGGLDSSIRIDMSEFKRLLQCATHEPELDGDNGIFSLMQLAKPTKGSAEIMCVWMESKECQRKPWNICHKLLPDWKRGKFPLHLERPGNIWLIRVVNGSLLFDWPWGQHRFQQPHLSNLIIIKHVLRLINDMPDSLFFVGEEMPILPPTVPFPMFSATATLQASDLPLPLPQEYMNERNLYNQILSSIPKHIRVNGSEISVAYIRHDNQSHWSKRLSKACWYGSFNKDRQVLLDLAVKYPDLIDAKWVRGSGATPEQPWNPLSAEENYDPISNSSETRSGFMHTLRHVQIENGMSYNPQIYKYLIVCNGWFSLTSGRLLAFLAHSGSVVLLQKSSSNYHFSSRLKPWVHYVPISTTGADIIHKIKWLRRHDNLARRIARNGYNFGRSYLRLEDYLCYTATALESLGKLLHGSDVLEPFNATYVK